MENLRFLRYYLRIEVDIHSMNFHISKEVYPCPAEKIELTKAKPLKLPMDSALKLTHDLAKSLPGPTPYKHLIGKLIYLTITRPDIAFSVHILSEFMQKTTFVHSKLPRQS